MNTIFRGLAIGVLLTAIGSVSAHADLFKLGSTFNANGSNSPTTFNSNAILTLGLAQDLSSDLQLTISEAKVGADEWLTFSYKTIDGAPLSQPGSGWSINQLGLTTTQKTNFIAAFSQYTVNGVAQTPTGGIFPGYVVENSPVPGLTGFGVGASGFTDINPAGPLGNLGAFLSPWGQLSSSGIDPTTVNDYSQSLEFAPVATGAPEASTWVMMGLGFMGLNWAAARQSRKSRLVEVI
jgi:hypothetical protein